MVLSLALENLVYGVSKSASIGIALFPHRQVTRLAIPLGKLWFRVDGHHRRIALHNLRLAFGGEIQGRKLNSIAEANFVHLTRVILEIPSLLKLCKENVGEYAVFSGVEYLKNALSRGKGILFLSAHLGNWELMAMAASVQFDLSFQIVVRPVDFVPLDRVLEEIRTRTGNKLLVKHHCAAEISQALREKQNVAILLDQNASWHNGVYVPFFGRIVCTNRGLALLALRHEATVIPVFNIQQSDGRYRIMFEPAVSLIRTGNFQRDVMANTALFNTIIEKYVRMAPDNWLWVHRRWRMKGVPEKARKKMFDRTIAGPIL